LHIYSSSQCTGLRSRLPLQYPIYTSFLTPRFKVHFHQSPLQRPYPLIIIKAPFFELCSPNNSMSAYSAIDNWAFPQLNAAPTHAILSVINSIATTYLHISSVRSASIPSDSNSRIKISISISFCLYNWLYHGRGGWEVSTNGSSR
jgi:hypothetical protein